jgi:hypothetical protein
MTSISGAHLPANSVLQSTRARAPALAATANAADDVSNPQSKGKVSRLNPGGVQAHAVFSYGHTAQLHHGRQLGSLLDIHA